MIFDYFEDLKPTNHYATDLVKCFLDKYNFISKRQKYGDYPYKEVMKDITSVLNDCFKDEKLNALRNFTRVMTKDGYLYSHLEKTTCYVLPVQTSFDYDEPEETTDIQEDSNTDEISPLLEDIKAADYINITDPMFYWAEKSLQMDIENLDEVTFVKILHNKKIQVTISNV
jgi:hypothetical protein